MVSSLSEAQAAAFCELWRLALPSKESDEEPREHLLAQYTLWVEQCAPLAKAGVGPVPAGVEVVRVKFNNLMQTVRKWEEHQRGATLTAGASMSPDALPRGCCAGMETDFEMRGPCLAGASQTPSARRSPSLSAAAW